MSPRSRQNRLASLIGLFPSKVYDFLKASGASFINDVGEDVVKNIVVDILCGRNLREAWCGSAGNDAAGGAGVGAAGF